MPYYRLNGNPVKFDDLGNLVDQVTNETGSMMLPNFTVRGISPDTRAKNYSSSFNRYALPDLINWGMENTIGKAMLPIVEKYPVSANILKAMTPSSYIGTLREGKAPWDLTNTGFGDSKDMQSANLLFDLAIGPKILKGANKGVKAVRESNKIIPLVIISLTMNSSLDPSKLSVVNKLFRNSEWSNFLSTRNGDNYYRMLNISGLVSTNINRNNLGYFLSHTTPWEEFAGLGASYPIGTKVLYEFPTKTFGELKSVGSNGYSTTYNVTDLGKMHLLYGNTSSGIRDLVRVLSKKDAKLLDTSEFQIGRPDRPLKPNGLYDTNPIYEDISMGYLTAVSPEVLNNALTSTTYNIFEPTTSGILRSIFIPSKLSNLTYF